MEPGRRRLRAVAWLAVALLVAGFVIAVASRVNDFCAFVPCDAPIQPVLGWSQGPDGRTILEVGPVSGPETTTVELGTAEDANGASTLLWRITRAPGHSTPWDGTVALGETPAGFTQTTPLTVPVPAGAQVWADNGCYPRWGTVPRALPARGILTDGGVMTPPEFAGQDTGYPTCPVDESSPASDWGWVVMAAGAVLLVWRARSVRLRPYSGPLPPAGPGAAIEVDRTVTRNGAVHLAGRYVSAGKILAGRRVSVRIEEATLMLFDPETRELLRTRPSPLTWEQARALSGARPAGPPPRPPAGPSRPSGGPAAPASS